MKTARVLPLLHSVVILVGVGLAAPVEARLPSWGKHLPPGRARNPDVTITLLGQGPFLQCWGDRKKLKPGGWWCFNTQGELFGVFQAQGELYGLTSIDRTYRCTVARDRNREQPLPRPGWDLWIGRANCATGFGPVYHVAVRR